MQDLFEQYETLPPQVQSIIDNFDFELDLYQDCEKMQSELLPLGYTFDFGLCGVPYNLRKI